MPLEPELKNTPSFFRLGEQPVLPAGSLIVSSFYGPGILLLGKKGKNMRRMY